MRTTNEQTRIEVANAIRRAQAVIDAFIASATKDGPISAMTHHAEAAYQAQTEMVLLKADASADTINERAMRILMDDGYVFGHALTRDAERRAARAVIEVCMEALGRE